MLERDVAPEVLLAMSAHGTRLLRNNTGMGWTGDVTRRTDGSILIRNPRPLHAGLCKGSSDYIGWHPLVVTEGMIGSTLAVFTGVETKRRSGGRLSDEQKNFIHQVRQAGGIAGRANSAEEALSLYEQIPGQTHGA